MGIHRLFISDRQIGVLDGIVFGVGLLAEIPSGAMADIIGRKNMVKVGLLVMGLGFLAQGFAESYYHILFGAAGVTIGWAFVSGADDALVYDSLKSEKKQKMWQKVIARKYQFLLGASLISYTLGDILYRVDVRYPFIFMGVSILAAFGVSFTLHEVHVKSKVKFLSYAAQIRDGSRFLLNKRMMIYSVMGVAILGMGYAFSFGLLRPLMLDRFGYFETGQSIIISVGGLLSIVLLTRLEYMRKKFGDNKGLIVLAALMALGFGVASLSGGLILGAVAFMLIYVPNDLATPWLNNAVQHRVPSSHRATALSTLSLLKQIPYIIIAPIAGIMSQAGSLPAFFFGASAVLFVALALLIGFLRYARPASQADTIKS